MTMADTAASAVAVSQPLLLNDLAGLINKTVEAAQVGGQFLADQLPDVIHQLLVYNAVADLIRWGVGLALVLNFFISLGIVRKKWIAKDPLFRDSVNDLRAWPGVWLGIKGVAAFIGFIMFLCNWDWLQIWLAPKVYLIQYATDLVKQASGK